jgi:hypothetical protein
MNSKESRGYIVKNSSEHIEGLHRAFKLDNGTIFTVLAKNKEYTLEFENMMLYEVIIVGYDEFMQPIYERTGLGFTPDQLNAMMR